MDNSMRKIKHKFIKKQKTIAIKFLINGTELGYFETRKKSRKYYKQLKSIIKAKHIIIHNSNINLIRNKYR